MALNMKRVPVREQDPLVRAHNFEEVSYGYNQQEALAEASRCLNCKKPMCMTACPVSVKIPLFISKIVAGDIAAAADVIAQDSSLPAICGRVCPQETQCEGSCILGKKGEPIAIGRLERFVADWSREHSLNETCNENGVPERSGAMQHECVRKEALETEQNDAAQNNCIAVDRKKVAVVGSGPSGLACASDLAKLGYDVTIYESLHKAGGVLVYGIPEFRLPKEKVVAAELENVKKLGVKIITNVVVGKTVTMNWLRENYDAIFLGQGAGLPKFSGIPGEDLNGVSSANEFLTRNNLMGAFKPGAKTPIIAGARAVVIGGGNVAMDAARTALRLGADVTIVYRRSMAELPARAEQVHHAQEEGVKFMMLMAPVEVLGNEKGWVRALRCQKMVLGEPDESGRRKPVPVEGEFVDIETDTVISALGTSPNRLISLATPELEVSKRGTIVANEELATSIPGVYAGGDAVTGAATVILAMGAGRKAAASIHQYLQPATDGGHHNIGFAETGAANRP
ncbi:MAG: NADPH-dependent glutamate synthase [Bacteroidales bacterium]|nr:NADPH-dependent glutamate synthase [Candidatus Egerieousia equi]